MNVSIIIPNWNGKRLLAKNLPLVIKAQKNNINYILEIIVVDDASEDDSLKFLKENFKGVVRVIKHKKNRGFASAVNTGARHANGELLCLLNTDVSPNTDFLGSVLKHFDNENLFAVVLHEKGNGPATGKMKNGFLDHKGAVEAKTTSHSLWASGGSAVFRRSIWWKLGGLDFELFNPFYWEDVDISYRAWKRGYKILWEPNALVTHNHEGTINSATFRKQYMDRIKERNELLFLWKNISSQSLWRKHLIGLVTRVIKHPGYIKIVFLALQKRNIVFKKRSQELKQAIVSDEAIFTIFNP